MKIEQITLYVYNLELAKDFLVKYFAASCSPAHHDAEHYYHSYLLTFEDGASLRIVHKPALANHKDINHAGFSRLAFSLGSKEAVDELTARIAADGFHVLYQPQVTAHGRYESCVLDIEENQYVLTV